MVLTNCPSCGAPLSRDELTFALRCGFCGTVVRDDPGSDGEERIKHLLRIGDRIQAHKLLVDATENDPGNIRFWIMRGNCSEDVKDRDRSYAAADRLRPSLGKDTSVLEVRWDSMVFNWHCNLSVDGEPVALGGMQRYRLLLPSGKHNIVFSCEGKRLSVGKAIDLDSDKVVSLAIKSGILGQKLIIQ
ncbi:MAG: hypothetical protein IKQ93_09120 [Candidatus Methanomethylophilaceae archaeon]|nr:hypothetical protein [Candidatus Methanomethylophilaceae archaeon]